jgi:surfeit locus 1 family protein
MRRDTSGAWFAQPLPDPYHGAPMTPLRITRAGLVGSLLVLLVAATCVRLGIWQLHRLAQRRAHNALVAGRMHAAPLVLRRAWRDTAGLAYRSARATGSWDPGRSIVLAGRSMNGEPGVYLLTPFVLQDGSAILVNRGWLPSPDAATVDLHPYGGDLAPWTPGAPAPTGDVGSLLPATPQGILLPVPWGRVPESGSFRRTWYHLDARALARQFPYRIEPLVLQLTPDSAATGPAAARTARTGAPPGLPRRVPPPALDEGPHFSYAIQWFSFAVIGIVGWIALLVRRNEAAENPSRT